MSQTTTCQSKINLGQRRAMLLTATILLVVVGFVTAAVALPPMGAYDFLITSASLARQAQGFCDTPTGETLTCREKCLTTIEGIVIPQGVFLCVDE